MTTTTDNHSNIKACVLEGISGYAVAKKYGVDPLSVAKRPTPTLGGRIIF